MGVVCPAVALPNPPMAPDILNLHMSPPMSITENSMTSWRWPNWPVCLVTLLLAVRMFNGWGQSPVNPFEDNVYLTGAHRLLEGQTIYRDFHSIYAPGIYYLPMWGLMLTGEPHLALAMVNTSISLTNLVLVAVLSTLLVSNRWARLLPLLGAVTYGSAGGRLTFALLGLLMLWAFVRSLKPAWLVVAGVLAAANLSLLQDMAAYSGVGMFFGAVACGYVVAPKERGLRGATIASSLVCAGFLLGSALWMGLMALNGTAWLYIQCAFINPLRYYDTLYMETVPPLWTAPPLAPGVISFWDRFGIDKPVRWFFYTLPYYWVPGAAIAALLCCAWKILSLRRRASSSSVADCAHATPSITLQQSAVLIGLAALGICMSRTIWRTGDELKLAVNSLPGIFLIAVGVSSLVQRRVRSVRIVGVCVALLMVVFLGYREAQAVYKSQGSTASSIELLRIGNEDLVQVTQYLRSHQIDGTIYVVPNAPVLYLSTGLKNATRADYLDPIIDPVVGPLLLDELSTARPRHVVIGLNMRFWNKYEFGKEFGVPIHQYILKHYTPVMTVGPYQVLARNDIACSFRPATLTSVALTMPAQQSNRISQRTTTLFAK